MMAIDEELPQSGMVNNVSMMLIDEELPQGGTVTVDDESMAIVSDDLPITDSEVRSIAFSSGSCK